MTTDPKSIDPRSLLPSDLTSEERALVDRQASRYHRDWPPEERFKAAFKEVEPTILARRQFFAAPQPETVGTVCPMCGKPSAFGVVHSACRDASGTVCPNCGEAVGVDAHRWKHPNGPDTFDCTKPAPCPTPEAGAASEMPEAVAHIIQRLQYEATNHQLPDTQAWKDNRKRLADNLELWWRSQPAKPASAGPVMTPEAERVIDAASARALWHLDRQERRQFEAICDDVQALRLQASQPVEAKRVRLPLTVKFLEYMRAWDLPHSSRLKLNDSLAELKREGIEG